MIADPFVSMVEVELDMDALVDIVDDEDRSSVVSSQAPGIPVSSTQAAASVSTKKPKATESKRRCRLCAKWQPEDCFPVICAYCRQCKQAVDNLAKQAARQNQHDYWKEVRNDEQELKKLVTRYLDTCPKSTDKGKRGTFNLASYREVFSASTSSGAKAKGRIMWEGYFVEFAQKPKGGSHTEAEARKRWKEMLEDPAVDKDDLGPAKAPRRCCVPTFDEVSHGSKLSHGKVQDLQTKKDTKNVSAEQAAKDRRMLLRGHERGALNKNGELLDFGGAVSGMLASSACGIGGTLGAGGSAFAGQGAFIPDISMLKKELEEEEAAAAAEDAPEVAATGNGAGGAAPDETEQENRGKKRPANAEAPPTKKQRWFDAEAAWSLGTFCAELDIHFCGCVFCSCVVGGDRVSN